MAHDTSVQELLAWLATHATQEGYVVVTDDLAMALETAAWKLQQHTHPDTDIRHAYHADRTYRYSRRG